jgi:HEAT repeat protein
VPQLDFLASRKQRGGETYRAARSSADTRALPASVRHASDAGAGTRKNRDLFRVPAVVRPLLDNVFFRLDFLTGFVGIHRTQPGRDLERFSAGKGQRLEPNSQLGPAGHFAAALGVGNHSLNVGAGRNEDLPIRGNRTRGLKIHLVAFAGRASVDRVHHTQQDVSAFGNLSRGPDERREKQKCGDSSHDPRVQFSRGRNVSKQAFDKKIDALGSLRSAPASAETAEQLRKALKDRNNFLVSKAAALAGEFGLQELVPDLLAAFDRFLVDPVKSDKQCWAKIAIAKAVTDLGHDDPAFFLRGIKCFQPEPSWGPVPEDSAVTLRCICALALVACPLPRMEILMSLVDLLAADPAKPVRIDAARAMAQLSGFDSVLLLRLKALSGDKEPEVIGQCFASLLSLSPRDYIPFVADFMNAEEEDVRLEAVAALGECHEAEAVEVLKRKYESEPELKKAILLSLGASRQPSAVEFLLSVMDATSIVALASGRFRDEVRERVRELVKGDAKLTAIFEKEFDR